MLRSTLQTNQARSGDGGRPTAKGGSSRGGAKTDRGGDNADLGGDADQRRPNGRRNAVEEWFVGPEPSAAGDSGEPRRLGVYFGAFDPPHEGHFFVAKEAVRLLDLDQVAIHWPIIDCNGR